MFWLCILGLLGYILTIVKEELFIFLIFLHFPYMPIQESLKTSDIMFGGSP